MGRIRDRFFYFSLVSFLVMCTLLYGRSHIRKNNSTELEVNNQVSHLRWDSSRKIYVFISTGFEVFKLAPVILECHRQHIPIVTVFTGHDVDSIRPYLNIFNVSVDVKFSEPLNKNQPIVSTISNILSQSINLHTSYKDVWIIQGASNYALGLATFAFQNKIRFAYLVPWLHEEFDWTKIARLASYSFAPTAAIAENLVKEGIDQQKIYSSGNTVFDTVNYLQKYDLLRTPLELYGKIQTYLILVLLEAPESIENNFNVISGHVCSDCRFVVPASKDSISGNTARQVCGNDPRFLCTASLSFVDRHWLFKNSHLILTDSYKHLEEMAPYNTKTLFINNKSQGDEKVPSQNVEEVQDVNTISSKIDKTLTEQNSRPTNKKELKLKDSNAAANIVNVLKTHLHDTLEESIDLLQTNSERFSFNVASSCSSLQNSKNVSVAVILQVFKRNTLEKLLDCAVRQTLVPKTIVIFQNGYAFDISATVYAYKKKYPNIDIQHIASSKNLRFHGRFHLAYLQTEDYVSVWDDDVSVDTEWLEYAVQYSKSHNCSLIGANCRKFVKVNKDKVVQDDSNGLCDFVGHVWTLPRLYLIFYLEMTPVTYYTGEDVQLSYALQKHGIASYNPPMSKHKAVRDMGQGGDKHASWKTSQSPRHLLFCMLISKGFVTLKCSNCNDKTIVEQCIALNIKSATEAELKALENDRKENVYSWSR